MEKRLCFLMLIIGCLALNTNAQTDSTKYNFESGWKLKDRKIAKSDSNDNPCVVINVDDSWKEVKLNLPTEKPPFFARRWVKNTGRGLLVGVPIAIVILIIKNSQSGSSRQPKGVNGNGS